MFIHKGRIVGLLCLLSFLNFFLTTIFLSFLFFYFFFLRFSIFLCLHPCFLQLLSSFFPSSFSSRCSASTCFPFFFFFFLVAFYATLHPALSVRRSVGPSVRRSVGPSVGRSVTLYFFIFI